LTLSWEILSRSALVQTALCHYMMVGPDDARDPRI
jgi:hypothetical protein